MPEPLTAVRLDEPELRFNYENRRAIERSPYNGLRNLGPYDAAERRREGQKTVRVVIVGQGRRRDAIERTKAALSAQRMGKLHEVFQLEFVDQILVPDSSINGEAQAYRRAIEEWLMRGRSAKSIDLAIVLHGNQFMYRNASPYYASKAVLLQQGIPTQSICYDNVSQSNLDQFRQYYVTNILTACYAKIGGIPWVVNADVPGGPELTVGVATTAIHSDEGSERFVGISTIFRENGAFALWDITAPEQDLDTYEEQLERSVANAIEVYETRENRHVSRIACHVSGKRAGRRESEAVRRALSRFGRAIRADIVHVSEDSPLWLFDGREPSHLPESGLITFLELDGGSALMHTEGRGGWARFLTRPLKLRVHSEIPDGGCLDVYQHLYDLRWMSWRGVRTSGGPVSIEYPQKMARLLAYLHRQEEVEALSILPQLKTKAWFL